jgi:hypothetical protein
MVLMARTLAALRGRLPIMTDHLDIQEAINALKIEIEQPLLWKSSRSLHGLSR